jgi:hypothetical protein
VGGGGGAGGRQATGEPGEQGCAGACQHLSHGVQSPRYASRVADAACTAVS